MKSISNYFNFLLSFKQISLQNAKNEWIKVPSLEGLIGLESFKNSKRIQVNSDSFINVLCFDIDHEEVFVWEDFKYMPTPNLVIYNKTQNRKHHIVYFLEEPVYIGKNCNVSYKNLYEDVFSSINELLRGDKNFTNTYIKNPFNNVLFDVLKLAKHKYLLTDFIDVINEYKVKVKKLELETDIIGRNVSIFNSLRKWSYKNCKHMIQEKGTKFFEERLMSKAKELNNQLEESKLSDRELVGIYKSIAKFSIQNKDNFDLICRGRYKEEVKHLETLKEKQSKSCKLVRTEVKLKNEIKIEESINKFLKTNEKITVSLIIEDVKLSEPTVLNTYKNFKTQIKEHNLKVKENKDTHTKQSKNKNCS